VLGARGWAAPEASPRVRGGLAAYPDTTFSVARIKREGEIAAGRCLRDRDLPALWAAADDSGRRLLTEALFERVEVLGVQSVAIHPTPEADAHGWSDAFGPEPLLLNTGRAFRTNGRGERSHTATTDVFVPVKWPLRILVSWPAGMPVTPE